jgi:uncharacterized protein
MTNSPASRLKKHVPQRTCVSCRRTGAKRGLVRLVAIPGQGVEVDKTGKISGRGAYLCPERECWVNALKNGRLEHALRTNINTEGQERLIEYAKNLAATNC